MQLSTSLKRWKREPRNFAFRFLNRGWNVSGMVILDGQFVAVILLALAVLGNLALR